MNRLQRIFIHEQGKVHELIHEFSDHEVKFHEPKHDIRKLLMNYRWFHEPFINISYMNGIFMNETDVFMNWL